MDTSALVKEGQLIVRLMDDAGYPPKGAMLVHNPEIDSWRLWLVPPDNLRDKLKFYGKTSSLIVDNQADFSLLDAGDIDLRFPDHPAIQGLGDFIHMDQLGAAHFSGNTFNGFYLPDGIVLRMAI
ncbi:MULTISPECIES: hypothetical protein [Citromicrobium]|uniref:hypothetical protein n=1 Tax=Citromicrobium TaxID=72173 RepID=UPI000A7EFD10|nr:MULTISPECIES: hypothetical protein [Citromicrobium]